LSPGVIVEVGGIPILLRPDDSSVHEAITQRFAGFLTDKPSSDPFELTMRLEPGGPTGAQEPRVVCGEDRWRFERGDFQAEWSPRSGRGWVRCKLASAPTVDSVVRILHSLLLARQGGFLLHSGSVIRNGRAFIFAGVSGAGKTTITRLAPPDVTLLTDEISYIRPGDAGYLAYGTPFAGDLGIPGTNVSAPVKALYVLSKGPRNIIEPLRNLEAATVLLRNILFFAEEPELVRSVFETACRFADRVPIYRLTFAPTPQVWELFK
jgi:hypothetical protein